MGGVSGRGSVAKMLEAGNEALRRRADIVIGYINPSKPTNSISLDELAVQQNIERLQRRFEVLAPAVPSPVGRRPGWFDVFATIKRAPAVVLIDSPMTDQSNGRAQDPGSRNPWRESEEVDIEDLLIWGIDVWTAMGIEAIW
jgi:K+-sensing histidine kinase KdpD